MGRRKNRIRTRQRRLAVELLEVRTVLSANPLYALPNDAFAFEADFDFQTSPPPPPRVPGQELAGGGSALETSPFPFDQTFLLNSLPGATKTIYLDFNGHDTLGTQWNTDFERPIIVTPTYSLDDDLINFSDDELLMIQRVWERVAEDFRPFNVNVTTQFPGIEALRNTGEGDVAWGQRVVIGGSTQDWYTPVTGNPVGGVAYGSFTWDSDTPCFVFAGDAPDQEVFIAEASSHETGHTLGLAHDGQDRFYRDIGEDPPEFKLIHVEYYAGHGDPPTRWGPIMGVSYGVTISQWSKGEYFNADNIQDDLAIITGNNGFGYREDDHGGTIGGASALDLDLDGVVYTQEGLISENTDKDYFSFEVVGFGEILNFDINPFHNGANLDVLARIYDSAGNELYRSNPLDVIVAGSQTLAPATDGGWAQLDEEGNVVGYTADIALEAGTYYLTIEGGGRPITFIDPALHPGPYETDDIEMNPMPPDLSDWGYSNYGSLGHYSITGTRKAGLLVGVDFDTAGSASPFNWTAFNGDPTSQAQLVDLITEAGHITPYDLTITTTGSALTTASTAAIDPADLPVHSLPLDDVGGYLTAQNGETLTFTWSDLAPDTVYQVYVFGYTDANIGNVVTVTGGQWNGETQTYPFTQIYDPFNPAPIAVNGDLEPGGDDLSPLSLLVISNAAGEIVVQVTNAEGQVAGVAGMAIAATQLGSVTGQVWNDINGDGGSPGAGEPGLPGWLVYLDTNNNGELDMINTPDTILQQNAPEVPQPIPDYATVKNELTITESGDILDVNVTINISHNYVGDLNVYLVAPDGTRVQLVKDLGGNGDNFTNTVFDDQAAVSINTINSAQAPFTGTYSPQAPLSVLNGMDSAGKWTLEIQDDQGGFEGVLNSWSIEVKIAGTVQILEPFQISDANGTYSFTDLKPGIYFVREFIQPQQFLDGWRQTWAAPPVLVTSAANVLGVDFGNWIPIFSPGSVAGQVWNDADGNGALDVGEVGLEGWTVYLDANKNGVRDVATVPTAAAATGLPKAISDFSTITSSIQVENVGSVLDIEVTLDITHSFMADIEAFLTSPSGRIVELFSGVGAQFNDFHNLTLSDDGAESIETIGQDDLPYTGVWRPEVPLATFFGDESFGLWTLTIRDTTFADEGTLNSWSLSVTTGELFTVTDANGIYQFDDVAPGQYVVREEVEPGWQQTYAPPIVAGANISVNAGAIAQADFGNLNAGPALPGDFDRSQTVDAADYVLFRKTNNTAVANPFDGADADGNGTVGPEDLAFWRGNFGQTLELGGGSSTFSESVSVASELSDSITLSGPSQADEASSASQSTATKSFSFSYDSETVNSGESSKDSTDEANAATASQAASTDAAFLALIDSVESGGLSTAFESDDEFDSIDNGDGELDESIEGVDALFELIGA